MRQGKGENALISSVSGKLTKQGFGLYTKSAPPAGFVFTDTSAKTAHEQREVEVLAEFSGEVQIAGHTVLHQRDGAPRVLVLADTPDSRRVLASASDPDLVKRFENEAWVARTATLDGQQLLCVDD